MTIILILLTIMILGGVFLSMRKKNHQTEKPFSTPASWIQILAEKVSFYRSLDEERKKTFEYDVFRFLGGTKITGIGVEVTLEDRLLVASSAVIPLFGFPAWNYTFLHEVLLYPSAFDRNFQLNNPNEIITGMVGNGVLEGKMILSKPALHAGFQNDQDKHNVGVHEFVHLFDKEDGLIDGIPPGFETEAYTLPWVELMYEKTKDIQANRSDINDYATTNRQEFFAVASEYFFERPKLLQKKHPKLYDILVEVFNQDPATHLPITKPPVINISRNAPCPCGSGKKYKKCCLA